MYQNTVAQDWAGQRGFKVWSLIELQVSDEEATSLQNELFVTVYQVEKYHPRWDISEKHFTLRLLKGYFLGCS